MVRLYFADAGHAELLTAEEEVDLARRIASGKRAAERLEGDGLGSQERRDAARLVADGRAARDHLVCANTRLVVSVAKSFIGQGVPFADLIQEGNLGLMRAAEKFDHRRGNRFSTYATWWIRQMVRRAVLEQGRTIRLPVQRSEDIFRLARAEQELAAELGRAPRDEEIADRLGKSTKHVLRMRELSAHALSLDERVGEGCELGELVAVEGAEPDEGTQTQAARQDCAAALGALPGRLRDVLRLYYGFDDEQAHTFDEIADRMGVTRSRVQQLHEQALDRIRSSAPLMRRLAVYRRQHGR